MITPLTKDNDKTTSQTKPLNGHIHAKCDMIWTIEIDNDLTEQLINTS